MIPEIPDLPELQSQHVTALRMQNPQLPGLPHLRTESILGYNPAAVAAAEYAQAVAVAYEATRIQNAIMRARARQEERESGKEMSHYRY